MKMSSWNCVCFHWKKMLDSGINLYPIPVFLHWDIFTLFHQHCKRIYSAEILFEDCCNIGFIRQKDHTNPLEEEEETIEISQVDEDDQYEEELAHKEVGSCEHTQEEDIQHHSQPAKEIERNDCCFI